MSLENDFKTNAETNSKYKLIAVCVAYLVILVKDLPRGRILPGNFLNLISIR